MIKAIQGEVMRFYVKSETSPNTYLVDLLENKGNGACSCRDFEVRRAKLIREGAELFTDQTTCKHIRLCHKWLVRSVLTDLYNAHRLQVLPAKGGGPANASCRASSRNKLN